MTDGPRLPPGDAGWTDSHCHVQDRYLDAGPEGPAEVLGRAADAGVTRVVCVGTDPETSAGAVALASEAGLPVEVWATVGLHPHEAARGTSGLRELLDGPGAERVVAIGECGLDYYYEHSPRSAQLAALRDQLALAVERDLAVVLHVRDAFDDLFGLLDETGVPERTVVHCFTGGPAEAARCVAAGMVVSVSGIVTFKNAGPLREALTAVPLDRLMVETDSPFLAPVPHRGRPNEPAFVTVVGAAVASTLNLDLETLKQASTATASRVFRAGSAA